MEYKLGKIRIGGFERTWHGARVFKSGCTMYIMLDVAAAAMGMSPKDFAKQLGEYQDMIYAGPPELPGTPKAKARERVHGPLFTPTEPLTVGQEKRDMEILPARKGSEL